MSEPTCHCQEVLELCYTQLEECRDQLRESIYEIRQIYPSSDPSRKIIQAFDKSEDAKMCLIDYTHKLDQLQQVLDRQEACRSNALLCPKA
jgi:hypothetical protein